MAVMPPGSFHLEKHLFAKEKHKSLGNDRAARKGCHGHKAG